MKLWVFAGAAVAAMAGVTARAQAVHSVTEDAAAFGAREAVQEAKLSPDGSSVMYITPGAGPKTYAVISNLASGKSTVMTGADGKPEVLRWCNYSAPDRAVCRVSGNVDSSYALLGFQRLIAMNTDGTDAKLLGQPESFYDARIRQFDAAILDWGGAATGKVLMEREYVPEQGKLGTRFVRSKKGWGVDLVDTRTIRSETIEPANDFASGYMSDGRGTVRLMTSVEAKNSGAMTGRIKYFYRTKGSRDWQPLVDFADWDDQIQPLAIDS